MLNPKTIDLQYAVAVQEAEALVRATDGRPRTDDEQRTLAAAIAEVHRLDAAKSRFHESDQLQEQMAAITGGKSAGFKVTPFGSGKSVGQQFIDDPAMKEWLHATQGKRASGWRSPMVDLQAAVLTGDPASGGDLVIPQYQPGIIPSPLPQITVADLLAPGTMDTNAISYMEETAFINAADAVAEGAVKPESTITFDAKTETAKKVATWLPVSDEMLDDVPALKAYLDTRLMGGVRVKLDAELLKGSGIAPHFLGLLNRPGLTAPLPVGTMTPADAIATQAANILVATEGMYPVNGVVLHPLDYLVIALEKDAQGRYINGGPSQAPLPRVLWGYPVALATIMTRGEALIGAFKTAAQFFQRGPIRTQASQSHEDFWIRNLTAIRSEVRGSLAVYRPAAFGLVTGIVAPAP